MEVGKYLKENIRTGERYAVMGIGSTLRADDAAGMYFIELLGKMSLKDNVVLIAGSTAPENFTGVIKSFAPHKLFIVDAAHLGLDPGEAKLVPAEEIGGVSFSTHMLPLSVMLEYLKTEISCEVVFIGIQPKCTHQGFCMSEEVKKGTERLAQTFGEIFGMKDKFEKI